MLFWPDGDNWLLVRMMFLIPLILSLTVHEWAHARSAMWAGDDTALRLGRVTLNPLAHVDPVGSLLLPMLGVPFGWAKPVPFNPGRFRREVSLRKGVFCVAAAGPASNLVIAAVCGLLLAVGVGEGSLAPAGVTPLLKTCVFLNVLLAVFNMLPIPPLDGSHIADCLMPACLRPLWNRFCGVWPVVVVAVLVTVVVIWAALAQ